MCLSKSNYFLLAIIFVILLLPGGFLSARATSADVADRRAELERELAKLESEIEEQRVILQKKQREAVSLERDLAIFDAKIQAAELSIRARDLAIRRILQDIAGKEETIDVLSEKLSREKISLAQLVRKTHELDAFSLVEVVLSNRSLSGFFSDLEDFTSIKAALADSFSQIEQAKTETRREKNTLEEKQREEQELRRLQILQKQRIEEDKAEKRRILEITKGEERVYQQLISAIEQDAVAIRTELFSLRGTDAIPFGEALDLANRSSRLTGIRPALLLAVIAQESNLGENVGQCLLTNEPRKGDGKGVNTGRHFSGVMKPNRDVDVFMNILERLGFDPFSMVVSCPPGYGYGGAMGPAQFIPSTWVLYEDRVAKLTGNSPPNPWDPEDAFTASALLLSDNGADRGTYAAERLAALRYFAGWRNATNPAYAFYGDDVMALAAKYQRQIDILAGS